MRRSEALADGFGECLGVIAGGDETRRAAAVGAFAVDDFAHASVLKEDTLARFNEVPAAAELLGDMQHWSRFSSIFDAGVAIGRNAHAEIERSRFREIEAEVGGENRVLRVGAHVDLKGSAIECQQQRSVFVIALREMHRAGGADKDFATTGEGDFGGPAACSHGSAALNLGGVALDVHRSGDLRVVCGECADRLLTMRLSAASHAEKRCEERRQRLAEVRLKNHRAKKLAMISRPC